MRSERVRDGVEVVHFDEQERLALRLEHRHVATREAATLVHHLALAVAEENAKRLGLSNLRFVLGSWFWAIPGEWERSLESDLRFDLVASNPPYVAGDDPHLLQGDLRFEPAGALTDFADGLSCIRQLIAGAPAHLRPGGWLLMEHGWQQAPAVRELLSAAGFIDVASWQDLAGHERVTGGRWR